MSEQMAVDPPPLKRRTKVAYGFGAAAYGVKDGGFNFFFLFFFSTVVGVDPGLVGLALLIALIVDAISDPVVGYMSDNWSSRWGRRHPFMYAAAIPVSISYFLLWNPPQWSDLALFFYVTTLAIIIRTFITFFETPSTALAPELATDYDERTSLISYRLYFGWTGGNLMAAIMFGYLLLPTEANPVGMLNREAYATYGIMASALMFSAIMICALGTHSRIPHLRTPPPPRQMGLRQIFAEIIETLSEKSFVALFIAALLGAVASGLSGALTFQIYRYFWEFTETQIFLFILSIFVSALLGFIIAPLTSKALGKKRAVIVLGAVAFSAAPMPIIFRLFGLMPANGDPILLPIVLIINTLDVALIIALMAIFQSMIADLVEQSELKTGRRSEGTFFSSVTFTRKCATGVGGFVAGLVLSFARFPDNPIPGEVSSDVLFRLGALYAPTMLMVWTGMIIAVSFYKIERADHEENLRKLKERAGHPAP